jgi:SOS-response transcriptional repressor LexA
MKGITERQKETLDFIVLYMAKNGIAPSYSEMLMGLNVKSKARVHANVCALRERGYIDYSPRRARSITVLFSEEGSPNWENVARALFLQNRILRTFVSSKGWEADLPPLEMP